jgi:hypothetical protein
MSTQLFKGGAPTGPDIDRIIAKFGTPQVHAVIKWEEIEEVLGLARTKSRFRTIVYAWRRKLYRELNIVTEAVPGVGVKVLDPHQRIDLSGRRYRTHVRGVRRAGRIAERTDSGSLTQDEIRVRDALCRGASAISLAAATAAKQIDYNSRI